ncbi:MAG: glycosyltransferase family 2 protein [Rhodospirillales bacterium]|nr:glycosyltransferase family 2 protein [Rhodospirillales bacterium]
MQSCLRVLKSVSEGFLTAAGAQGAAGHELVADVMRCLGNLRGGILGTDLIATLPADEEKLAGLLQRYRPISFNEHSEPDVSIIIPAYNSFFFTYQCLISISRHLPRARLQMIVVDDCSIDETVLLARIVHGVRIIRNAENRGFVESCNLGARAATAPYIMLLNNDTQVTPGAIDALVETLQDTNAGLVGSKLLYPDGRLQEAGGIIWRNGTGWNYGRLEDPDHPYYNYRRPVDYCSGASIMLPRALWKQLGGFDIRYNPAYFEDVDLAFRVREAGYDVLYQPASVVVHWEGISNGKVLDAGVKLAGSQRAGLPRPLVVGSAEPSAAGRAAAAGARTRDRAARAVHRRDDADAGPGCRLDRGTGAQADPPVARLQGHLHPGAQLRVHDRIHASPAMDQH